MRHFLVTALIYVKKLAQLNRKAIALSSGHGLALRLHRTVPAVEGGPTAFRPAVGSRDQA